MNTERIIDLLIEIGKAVASFLFILTLLTLSVSFILTLLTLLWTL